MRAPGRMLALTIAAIGVLAAPAAAQVQLPARTQTASLDSEAPKGAPPHWLPGEQWVMQHWLPYDERRLYSLLGADRGDDLAAAARRHPQPRPARASSAAGSRGARARAGGAVAHRAARPGRLALLERRALRTLTQGHLAQHLFFHSLHQEAIPSHATAIFGVASRAEWSALRRSELSPLQICRLNGLPRGHAQEQADGDAARVRRPGRRAPGDPGRPGGAAALAPAAPAPALAAADALQRPAADRLPARVAVDRVELLQQRGGLRRRPRSSSRATRRSSRSPSAAARSR